MYLLYTIEQTVRENKTPEKEKKSRERNIRENETSE